MKTKVRYHDLDLLKVLAIFFVCIYHFWYGGYHFPNKIVNFLNDYTYPFLSVCVPLFFMVNGALILNRKGFDAKKHYKSLLHLTIQFFLWHAITTLVMGILAGYDFFALGKAHLLNLFFFHMPVDEIEVNHLWFIPALFCVYMLYPFYKAIFSQEDSDPNARTVLTVFLAFSYIFYFLIRDFDNFKSMSIYLRSFATHSLSGFQPLGSYLGLLSFYFLLGGLLQKYREKASKVPALVCVLMILIGLALSYATVYVKDIQKLKYDPVFDGYGTNGTLLCTLGIFLLAGKVNFRFLEKARLMPLIECISANTLSIYYTHWILGRLIEEAGFVPEGFLWNILHGLFLVLAGTLIGLLLKRIPILKYLAER